MWLLNVCKAKVIQRHIWLEVDTLASLKVTQEKLQRFNVLPSHACTKFFAFVYIGGTSSLTC